MSYDRVLPKPTTTALYNDSSRQDHHHPSQRRPCNTLLEHKIMTDKFTSHVAAEEGDGFTTRRVGGPGSSSNLFMDKAIHSPPLSRSQSHSHPPPPLALRPSSNREGDPMTSEGIGGGSGGPRVPLTRRRVATLATGIGRGDSSREEKSPSLGSPKSAASSSKESVGQVQFCLCQPDPKIPRPRNAFILYRQHYQASVVAQNPGLANPEISKIIGEQWRALPNEIKQEWKDLAEEEKARHQQQYPDYRYQPRRYGRNTNIANSNAAAVAINSNSAGASVCSRCGGRIMNPPSTPSTPFTPGIPLSATASPRMTHGPPRSFQARATREGARIPSPVQIPVDPKAHPRQRLREDPSCLSPDPKRRRFSPSGNYTPVGRDISPDSQYQFSPRRASLPRPEAMQPRSAYPMGPPPRPYRSGQGHQSHDPNLTLPPLQTVSLSPPDSRAMVMTIPFINKIKVLAKISPPYASSPTASSGASVAPEARGAVVAVEGQDKESVNCMLQFLGEHLRSKEGEYNVRVFEGPDPDIYAAKSEEMISDATVQYLNTISAWHKISDEVVHFITDSPESTAQPASGTEEATSAKSIVPNVAKPNFSGVKSSPTASITRQTATTHIDTPITTAAPQPPPTPSTSTSPLPVALIPRYQLSTADAHACANPINDAYAPIEHWQWMASLWRGCVGPDITIYIRGCEKDELSKYGGGTPVENRLNDARSLVVRKSSETEGEIEEKALRRVGFEVEEFLRK
ncbi:hypothetical protein FQN54_000315 [Arachnomyces sp. PD_36]|nr:hypothetical protein FQN54_000315 [Arachnomyces sp. PD_36]